MKLILRAQRFYINVKVQFQIDELKFGCVRKSQVRIEIIFFQQIYGEVFYWIQLRTKEIRN